MNKIHPLFLILLLAIFIVFLHVKKLDIVSSLQLENRQLATLDTKLNDLSKIKNMWKNSSVKLENIIKNDIYKNTTFEKRDLKNKFILKVKDMSHSQFRTLINKILNSYIVIQKLSLQKKDGKLTMIVEIAK